MIGLHVALKLAESEFTMTKMALARLGCRGGPSWPPSASERLRWLNVRALRLALRVSHDAVARAMLAIWDKRNTLPPSFRLLAPASLTLLTAVIREACPRAEAEWREARRLEALAESLSGPLPMADEEAFVEAYRNRVASVRRATYRAQRRYVKRFRSNFWMDKD